MAQILVRNLDDTVVERLRLSAKHKGSSLEQEVRTILTEAAASLNRKELAARAAALRARQAPNTSRAVDLIREDRDR